MRLSDEEIKNIDAALEALKGSLKDELSRYLGQPGVDKLDDAFLKKVGDCYFSANGILCLLRDAHFLRDECGGPCHVTCVTPGKVACGMGSL